MPIGNLTSQIFANIYLNELDRFVQHTLKPLGYVRYGDDFILWLPDQKQAKSAQIKGTQFLKTYLKLTTNPKHDFIQHAYKKLTYLGVDIWPSGHRLLPSVTKRINQNLTKINAASYQALIKHHQTRKEVRKFHYKIVDLLD